MPFMYPIKRVFRNWKLFTALLIGIALAATFFASIDVKANLAAKQSLDQQLKTVNVDMEFNANLNLTEVNQAQSNILGINGVESVNLVSRFGEPIQDLTNNYTAYPQIVSFPNSSDIYNDWINKPEGGIGENQTYVISGTTLASKVSVGDNITTEFTFPTPMQDNFTTVYMNLTVAGFANLTDTGYSLLSGNSFLFYPGSVVTSSQVYNSRSDSMIIGWDSTLLKVWSPMANRTVSTTFLIDVDHGKLISPWNVPASATNVNTVATDIQNNVLSKYETFGYITNNLGNALGSFNSGFQYLLLEFIGLSLPVFFVSWYLGSTVSDVSFNMRRREIGLLSTKGLSSGQIQRMFLGEAITIGVVGGVAGVIGGLVLNQVFSGGFNLSTLFNPQTISPYTMVFTVIFGVAMGLASMFWSARKASKLPTVEALREYMDYTYQPYRKILPWVATGLGTYKIVEYLLGVNMATLISHINFSGEFFLSIITGPVLIFDVIMNYIGPLLFFWGITKLLIQNSLAFQRLITQLSRVMGDFGVLAAKNVRRNPARIAAIAFLIAFIIGYGVQVTGQIATQQDYLVRQVKYGVGADISIGVVNATKAPEILADILGNVTGIKNSTMVCQLQQTQGNTVVKTIDPDSFLATAYYEKGWFTGASMQQAFNAMKADNMTIILDRTIAQEYNLKVGDTIAIDFPSVARTLKIVGLFGPQPVSNQGPNPVGVPNSILSTCWVNMVICT